MTLIDATHASIVFNALSAGGVSYMIGANNAMDLNVGAASFTISPDPVTAITLPGFTAPSCSNDGSGNVSEFGILNLIIDCKDGFASSGTMFSFTLTNTGGTWLDEAAVLIANDKGNFAAAHILVCNTTPCDNDEGATCDWLRRQLRGWLSARDYPRAADARSAGVGSAGPWIGPTARLTAQQLAQARRGRPWPPPLLSRALSASPTS